MAYHRIETVSSSSQSSPTQQVIPSGSRNGITRNASFILKDVHGGEEQAHNNDQDDFEITNPDGQIIRIKDSGIVHTLSHKKCIAENASLGLVATLFYCPNKEFINPGAEIHDISCEDINFGNYVSDMAIFEFIQTIDDIMVPWKKRTGTTHKCLDVAPSPGIMEIVLSRPEILSLYDLRRHVDLWKFENKWKIQVVLQENNICRRFKRLVVFDMDSTLIQQEVIDEIANYMGVKDEVSAITARAMNGELDFTESLRQRVALLEGTPVTVFESLKPSITFTPGARELTKALKTLGYKMAVLSGGFMPLADYVKEELGLDYAYANMLAVSDDGTQLTGELIGDIIHAERKAELLEQIAAENGIALKQVIAIGDGANDLPMMIKAGLGIAFNAKPAVQLLAPCRLNSETLQDVLYLLGFTKLEQTQLLEV